jgi:hypothetical protein
LNFCAVHDHSQEDLAKFGYRFKKNCKCFLKLGYRLPTYKNLTSMIGEFHFFFFFGFFFPSKSGDFGAFVDSL